MSEKVTIEPQYIGDFVGWLGLHDYMKYSLGGRDPKRKLGKKEKEELQATMATVAITISRGLILAKSQPELADALVEYLNGKQPGYADELLSDLLRAYQAFLYYEHPVK